MLRVSAMIMQQLTDINLITYAKCSPTIHVKLDLLPVDQLLRTKHLHQIRQLLRKPFNPHIRHPKSILLPSPP